MVIQYSPICSYDFLSAGEHPQYSGRKKDTRTAGLEASLGKLFTFFSPKLHHHLLRLLTVFTFLLPAALVLPLALLKLGPNLCVARFARGLDDGLDAAARHLGLVIVAVADAAATASSLRRPFLCGDHGP